MSLIDRLVERVTERIRADREASRPQELRLGVDVERRRALVVELQGLSASREEVGAAKREACLAAEAHLESALAALRDAELALGERRWEEHCAGVEPDARIEALRRTLTETADPRIDVFASELMDLQQELRGDMVAGLQLETLTRYRHNFFKGKRVLVQHTSTSPSVTRRSRAIVAALRSLPDLKLEALTGEELEARIEVMRSGIPEIKVEDLLEEATA